MPEWNIPYDFMLCEKTDCPRAAACLRHIAYMRELETETILRVINPRKLPADNGGDCAFFRDATPVTYAFGFKKMQGRMFPAQYAAFKSRLMARYGRNPFFERRKGAFPLSPKEQAWIKRAARRAGVEAEFEFDSYEERYHWMD